MRLATWNVNSIRAREQRLLRWLRREQVDILCLQELKVTDADFPYADLRNLGYHAAVYGQKTYNGVAILSRAEPTRVRRGMGTDDGDPQARLIAADIEGVRVMSAYFPNGRSVGSDHYTYKLEWMQRFLDHLGQSATPENPLIVAGDFNVAVDDLDVAHPEAWGESVLCHRSARDALHRIRTWGLVDVFRQHHPRGGVYSWWDYRMLAFPKNDGLRIDHVFATTPVARRCVGASVDRNERKGPRTDKPSDHAPVIAEFEP